MSSEKKEFGDAGEQLIAKYVPCPKCKTGKLCLLRQNFKCADVICDFCGFLAQVKSKHVQELPDRFDGVIPGAAWKPQEERMNAGIYFSLYIVLADADDNAKIFFIPQELQTREMFQPRKPLGPNAQRAGWQGFNIVCSEALGDPIPLRINGENVFHLECRRNTEK